jgi:RNA polymerase sigma factor (sigma-70 family)
MYRIVIDPKNKGKDSSFYKQREIEIGKKIDEYRFELTDRVIRKRYLWDIARDSLVSNGLLFWKREFTKLPGEPLHNWEKVAIRFAKLEEKYTKMIDMGDRKAASLSDLLDGIYAARNDLVELNIPLMIKQMKKRGCTNRGEDYFYDIFQYALIGLMKSAHRFDYKFGWRFTAYTYYWINQYITEAMNMGANRKKRVRNLNFAFIDEKHDNGDGLVDIAEVLADPSSLEFEEEIIGRDLVDKVLEALPRRGADMVRMRLDDYTLEAISKVYDLSKERVRQIIGREMPEHIGDSKNRALREAFRNLH